MLNLARRHRKSCESGQVEDSRSGEFEERKKGWKRCGCPIHASGTLDRKFDRKTTGRIEWAEAREVAAEWEKANQWGDAPAPLPTTPSPADESQPQRKKTADAIASYLAEFEHAADSTRKNYRLLLKHVQEFGDNLGYVMIDQWKPENVRALRAGWPVTQRTAAKKMSTIRAFFQFCEDNEWIQRSPARAVRNPKNKDAADTRNEQKNPYSDEELKVMYEACETKYGKQPIHWSRNIHHQQVEGEYARYNSKWTGEDLADFITLSIHTGLRISDMCLFNSERLQPNGEVKVRPIKNGRKAKDWVKVWVPEWVQEMIRARAKKFGPHIFGEHQTRDINVITHLWRKKLNKLWELCGPLADSDEAKNHPDKFCWDDKPVPHRLRHSFARIMLQRDEITVRDVAELLGNTEQMVLKHYAAWVPERQERLTNKVKKGYASNLRPMLVASGTRG